MSTSIRISPELHAKLKAIQERMGAETLEEVVTHLIDGAKGEARSRFEAHREMKPFTHRGESHAT